MPVLVGLCALFYLGALAAQPSAVGWRGGLLEFGSPGLHTLERLGASGGLIVFGIGRWWTVLSAGWLHASLAHVLVNAVSLRNLSPLMLGLLGPARSTVVLVAANAAGFFLSSSMSWRSRGFFGPISVGASAALFGFIGALLVISLREWSNPRFAPLRKNAAFWVVTGVVISLYPGVDGWAHAGGFVAGALYALVVAYRRPEGPATQTAAAVLLALSLGAVAVSWLTMPPPPDDSGVVVRGWTAPPPATPGPWADRT